MPEDRGSLSSRRALLAAAAGGAAALAASAAMPLSTLAHDTDDLALNTDNPTTATTSISNVTTGSTGFEASSTGGAGSVSWSITESPFFVPADDGPYTGVFGFSPAGPDANTVGVGVWGDSDDYGVLGTGNVGVSGTGNIGVIGASTSDQAGIQAFGNTASSLALDVYGKVRFNRSGRATVAKHKSSIKVSLPGTTSSSRVFAVISSNRSGRWVRAAVPTTGSFTIYLNASVSSSTYVSWFVLN